jgi:hypothetical protein
MAVYPVGLSSSSTVPDRILELHVSFKLDTFSSSFPVVVAVIPYGICFALRVMAAMSSSFFSRFCSVSPLERGECHA